MSSSRSGYVSGRGGQSRRCSCCSFRDVRWIRHAIRLSWAGLSTCAYKSQPSASRKPISESLTREYVTRLYIIYWPLLILFSHNLSSKIYTIATDTQPCPPHSRSHWKSLTLVSSPTMSVRRFSLAHSCFISAYIHITLEVSSAALGGEVVACSDDFFASRHNLIKATVRSSHFGN